MKKEGFILYKSFYAPVSSLSDAQLGRLFRAIFRYRIDGISEVESDIQMAFNFFKSQMDNEDEKYSQIVEQRRIAGRMGGRPRKDEKAKKANAYKKSICKQKKHIGEDRKGKDIITSISTGVENTGVVAEDILPDPVEDQNACVREEKAKTIDPAHKAEFDRSAAEFDNPAIEAEIVDPAESAASHKTWKEDYETYLCELRKAYKTLLRDDAWISTQQRYNPNLNIPLTLEKACTTFWATEAGWQHKKRQRAKTIDWRRTLTNSISQPQNKVYNDNRARTATTPSGGVSNGFKRSILETLLGSGSAT